MKKVCFFIVFFSVFNVFAQDFTFQWVNDMSVFIGKRTRDIPDIYEQEVDKKTYSRQISEGMFEGFQTKDNFIVMAIWGKTSNSRSFLFSEYDRYINLIKKQMGNPMIDNDEVAMWNWRSNVLMVVVEGKNVSISICVPETIDLTQVEWDEMVKQFSNK